MQAQAEPELYPIGTAVLSLFIGDKDSGQRRNFKSGYGIDKNTGEYVELSGGYASDVYVPVSSKYTYQKSGNRLNTWAFYDKDKNYIQAGPQYNNLNVQQLNPFPAGVCFVRIQAFNFSNQAIQITRIG